MSGSGGIRGGRHEEVRGGLQEVALRRGWLRGVLIVAVVLTLGGIGFLMGQTLVDQKRAQEKVVRGGGRLPQVKDGDKIAGTRQFDALKVYRIGNMAPLEGRRASGGSMECIIRVVLLQILHVFLQGQASASA